MVEQWGFKFHINHNNLKPLIYVYIYNNQLHSMCDIKHQSFSTIGNNCITFII